ncbi:hypothetical protein [Streptomyces sp. NPDC093225]|uniref:hypothetical protein n=1 Tax=Streptomyces sp. NPDC093225 TaxID=3366034 RepID=UPI00382371FA
MATLSTSAVAATPEPEPPTTDTGVEINYDPNEVYDPQVAEAGSQLPEVTGADADKPAPTRCDNPYYKWYEVSSVAPELHMRWPGTSFKDGPGGTMLVSVHTAGKLKVEGTLGFETEVSGVVAAAKAKVDATLGVEASITVGHQYNRAIPEGMYGHVQYGSWGRKITWKKWESTPDRCGKRVTRTGVFNVPDWDELGWKFWKTYS